MKTLFILTVLLLCKTYFIYCATPVKIVEGKAEFAFADVGGQTAWTSKEKEDLIASMTFSTRPAPIVTNYVPSSFELSLSTSFKFKSYTHFQNALTMTNEDLTEAKKEIDRENKTSNFKVDKK